MKCPEGTIPIEGGGCLHVPDETPAAEEVATEDADTQEECETSDGIWDADTSTCTQTDPEESPDTETSDTDNGEASESLDEAGEEPDIAEVPPDHVVVYEGIATEEGCLVAGATWIDNQCFGLLYDNPEDAGISAYWHPKLMDDAFNAVDPHTVEADHWETFEIGGPWGFYNYVAFYHFDSVSDEDREAQLKVLQQVSGYAVRWAFMYTADWLYFPYRYDVSWDDQPDTVVVVGTYPLGEERTLRIHVDPNQREALDIDLPLPPPIRPTTPFTAPEWVGVAAEGLGRECPPVEEIWDGYGTEVTDPCTLKAVETAVDWMWRGDAIWRQRAIRDGRAMIDFLLELESFEDPHENALLGFDSRVNGWTYTENVKWAGQWPGASMISIEWNLAYPQREFTPEEYEARVRYRDYLVEHGYDVVDHYLDLSLGKVGWGSAEALIVRTQDGTWRMSQRSFCWWYQKVIRIDQEKLLCPDDPNPHFPDSAWFDHDIYPPSHKNYYQDPRANRNLQSLPHHDRGAPRRTGEYLGVPPS